MRVSGRFLVVFCALAFFAGASVAQIADQPPPAPPPGTSSRYFLHMQRVRYWDTACVLMRLDGQYQLEQTHESKTKVFRGSLSVPEVNNLWIVLNSDELKSLSQDKIPVQLVGEGDVDTLVIGIGRSGRWQNLIFQAESRKQFRKSVGPLLSWFEELQKAPHVQVDQDAANNCVPPKEPVIAQGSAAPAVNVAPSARLGNVVAGSAASLFLLRLADDELFAPNRQAERTCVIVYATGRYRFEKASQFQDNAPKARVYVASVESKQLEELRHILEDPDLKNLQEGSPHLNTIFSKAEFTDLSIPRPDRLQQLSFATYLGMPDYNGDTRYVKVDSSRILAPLRKWIKENLERRKVVPLAGATATDCVPSREEGGQIPGSN